MSKFDIRLRAFTPDGVRGRVIPTLTLKLDQVFGDVMTATATLSAAAYDNLPQFPVVAAVEFSNGENWAEVSNSRMIFQDEDTDAVDTAEIRTLSGMSFVAWMLQRAVLQNSTSAKNGQRTWSAATPGKIVSGMMLEAHNRGWGSFITTNATATADSAGNAWVNSDLEITYELGTPIWEVLKALSDSNLCEFITVGNALYMYNPGAHGHDYTVGTPIVQLSHEASSVPVKRSWSKVLTNITVAGAKNLLVNLSNPAAPTTFGRLEGWQSESGTGLASTATTEAQISLKAAQAPTREVQIQADAHSMPNLPWVTYGISDWVLFRADAGWESGRVVELVVDKDQDGKVTISTIFGDRKQSLLSKLAQKSASKIGTGKPVSLVPHPPAAPTGLGGTAEGYWDATGQAKASVDLSWDAVVLDDDGEPSDVNQYEVWWRLSDQTVARSLATSTDTTLHAENLPSGVTAVFTVRARSSAGMWGAFSAEATVVLPNVINPLDPPTAPSVTSKLGTVKVSWDGKLQGTSGPYTPPNSFAYTYTVMSDTETGTYTAVGQNLGHAGGSTVAGLTMGSTHWFKLYAVDRLGVSSVASAAVSVTVVGVKGPDIEANSLTANLVNVGSGFFETLSLGANAMGTPVNRVPAPLTDTSFWSLVDSGAVDLGYPVGSTVTVGTNGVTITQPATGRSGIPLTALLPIPASRKVRVSYVQNVAGGIVVFHYDAAGVYVSGAGVTSGLAAADTFQAPDGATQYRVVAYRDAAEDATTLTVSACSVFEVIGEGNTDSQSAEVSPAGLKLVTADGTGQVNLTTDSDQFLSIMKDVGNGFEAQASIDEDGSGQFQDLTVNDDVTINGDILVGDFAAAQYNGNSYDGPLLDRLARGTIYNSTWSAAGMAVTAQYQRIASGVFVLEDARDYLFVAYLGGLSINSNTSGQNQYLEMRINANNPMDIGTGGQRFMRSVVYNGTGGYYSFESVVRTGAAGYGFLQYERLAAGVPIYWQINTNAAAAHSGFTLTQGAAMGEFNIIDMGPSTARFDATDRSVSGTASASTATTSTTTAWGARWSASWKDNGATKLTGTGQWTDGGMLFQGYGSSPMGSRFGFDALGISGKTITKCQIYLKCRYTAPSSGVTARLGTGTYSSEPSTFGTGRTNSWDVHFNQGEGKWVNVPSSLWASIASGAIRGFSLGISGSDSDYAYFDGAGKSLHPQLKITYK